MHIGGDKAVYGASGGDQFAISGRADFFVSFDPERYVIFYICYDVNESIRGRCRNSEIFLMLKDQRDSSNDDNGVRRDDIILDDIHWTLIEETFKNCLGQQFVDETDPQIRWVWENDDCAKPGTSEFESGVSG
ncbi:uncharacterized protein LOC132755574 [Ruditapes philippinarum]|uniref:uncharacterized protein LOC132755574 n=1 Tax=Ruditapes philippinarum TaxID=129788 RepID=UPI00295A5876|nr:uncharacterized protein LOC132755574 [Ruditapes philippinarum]